jgi:hypothetical protein
MKKQKKTLLTIFLIGCLIYSGCALLNINKYEELAENEKGAKVFYQGKEDEISLGGGKGVYYERKF